MQKVNTVEEALEELKQKLEEEVPDERRLFTKFERILWTRELSEKALNLVNSLEAEREVTQEDWEKYHATHKYKSEYQDPEPKIDIKEPSIDLVNKYSDFYNSQTFANPEIFPPSLASHVYSKDGSKTPVDLVKSIWKPVSELRADEQIIWKNAKGVCDFFQTLDWPNEGIVLRQKQGVGCFHATEGKFTTLTDYINNIEERLTKLEGK